VTTISAVATPWTQFEAALRGHRPVEVSYHGRFRLICPPTVMAYGSCKS
jgi:hypothetical protein